MKKAYLGPLADLPLGAEDVVVTLADGGRFWALTLVVSYHGEQVTLLLTLTEDGPGPGTLSTRGGARLPVTHVPAGEKDGRVHKLFVG